MFKLYQFSVLALLLMIALRLYAPVWRQETPGEAGWIVGLILLLGIVGAITAGHE